MRRRVWPQGTDVRVCVLSVYTYTRTHDKDMHTHTHTHTDERTNARARVVVVDVWDMRYAQYDCYSTIFIYTTRLTIHASSSLTPFTEQSNRGAARLQRLPPTAPRRVHRLVVPHPRCDAPDSNPQSPVQNPTPRAPPLEARESPEVSITAARRTKSTKTQT